MKTSLACQLLWILKVKLCGSVFIGRRITHCSQQLSTWYVVDTYGVITSHILSTGGYKLLPINTWILEYKGIKWLPSNGIYIKDYLSAFTVKYTVSYQWVKIIKWFFLKTLVSYTSVRHWKLESVCHPWDWTLCLSQLSYHWVGDSHLIFSTQWNRKMISFLSSVLLSFSHHMMSLLAAMLV